ncbi:MAG: Cna B-type domain-containing protein [Erysipelotrichaceae bacterium]|nr:Cna B-type domain-containing protein [Erysipelotrichaceae bacterium]
MKIGKKIRNKLIGILAILVVFVTVYSLVLPAVAITDEAADQDPGIHLTTIGDNTDSQGADVSKDNSAVDTNNETDADHDSSVTDSIKEILKFYGEAGDSVVYVEAPFDAFPEGTTMEVKEVVLSSEQYDSINDQIKDKEVKVLKALDITFRDKDNNEVEPKDNSKVKVSITDKELSGLDNAFVAHIDEKEQNSSIIEDVKIKPEDVEVLTNTEEITEIVENNDSIDEITVDNTVTFETDSFSLYVLAYTVDFYYGEYEYHLEGGLEIGLIQLFNKLGINFNIDDIETVSFSDPDLVAVYQVEGNWILSSKQSFDTVETLTIKLKDGGEIVIRVEDEPDDTTIRGTWNLADVNNTEYLRISVDSSITEGDQDRDVSFGLTVSYSLKEEVVRAIDALDGDFSLTYDLSSLIANSPLEISDASGTITVGTSDIGSYTIVNGLVTLVFTDESFFDEKSSFEGFFTLSASTNESDLGDHDEYTFSFPGTTDTIKITYKTSVEEGSKSVYYSTNSDGSYTLHYSANVTVNSELDSLVLNDTLSGIQVLNPSSVKLNGSSVSVNQTSSGFALDIKNALGTDKISKGTYQVTYDTVVYLEELKALTTDKTTETNTASWTVNGDKTVPGGSTTQEFEKPADPIPVDKTILNPKEFYNPGDVINYNITYGDSKTVLAGFEIVDMMTDVQVPQGSITISYNGQSITINPSSNSCDSNYSTGMVTLFDYTFSNNTEGYGPVTVTYSTKLIDSVTAKNSGIYDITNVSNTAQEKRQNTQDTTNTTVTYEKEPNITVSKTENSTKTTDGKWIPGSEIQYTITIGDSNTNISGAHIIDQMTDLQVLQGDVMVQLPNGTSQKLSDFVSSSVVYNDDGKYSSNSVPVIDFSIPDNFGNGPVIITYTTKVITQSEATSNGIYGDKQINNNVQVGKNSDSTSGTGVFDNYPIEKTVTQENVDVNGQTVEIGSTVHYRLVFGNASMNMGGKTVTDEMTYLQKLASVVTITKANGNSYQMPTATSDWADDGVVWGYFTSNANYNTSLYRVFNYKMPDDIGNGPIVIEYDATIISLNDANNAGIKSTQHAYNKLIIDNNTSQTDVIIEFPTDPKHDSQVSKQFDRFDVSNNKVYWKINVEKTSDSAYPLENITVRESDWGGVYITESKVAGWNNHGIDDFTLFDAIHAVVTTDDGTELTPGIDYTVNKNDASFTFPVLTERVHISLAFNSPIKIVDGYYMHNKVRITNNNKEAEAECTYSGASIIAVKNGNYDEEKKLVKWQVVLNPSANEYNDSDPVQVMFEDTLPEGLYLVNYDDYGSDHPSVLVTYQSGYWSSFKKEVTNIANNHFSVNITAFDSNNNKYYGLDKNKIIVEYYTKITDSEWDRITSSVTGSKDFENHSKFTAGNNEIFEASDKVTIISESYLKKYDDTMENGHGIVIDNNSNETKRISYRIEINPNGYCVNNGQTLSLTDLISTNMDLDTSSVHLYTATMNSEGHLDSTGISPTDVEISYNDDSRLLSIKKLVDEQPYLLTYSCIARAQGEDSFRNTATLIGGGSHSSSTNEAHKIQTSSAGVRVNGINMDIHKIDENNISQNLRGAVFQLYECELFIGSLTSSDAYPQSYWDNLLEKVNRMSAGTATDEEIAYVNSQFKIINYVPVDGGRVTTGANGKAYWFGLKEHTLYAWKEVTAPSGYTCNQDYHYFVGYQHIDVNSGTLPQPLLPENEQLNRKHAAWALDDACQFANSIIVASMSNLTTWTATNIEDQYTSISATKSWQDDSDDLFETRPTDGIQLQLVRINADGTRTNVGSTVSINVDSNGNWPNYIWNKLPSRDDNGRTIKYTVVEQKVENYTTSYSDNQEGVESGSITITNKLIPKTIDIPVKKVFAQSESAKPEEIMVQLIRIASDANGTLVGSETVVGSWQLSADNNWSHVFESLPTTGVSTQGQKLYYSYSVREDLNALIHDGFNYIAVYSDNGEGVVDASDENPLTIVNTKYNSIKISKSFSGVNTLPEEFYIEASYSLEGIQKRIILKTSGIQPENVTLSGTGTATEPFVWTISKIPVGTSVTFTEYNIQISGYSLCVNHSTVTGDNYSLAPVECLDNQVVSSELVNDYGVLPTELKFTKIWRNSGSEITEWQDGVYIDLNINAYTSTKAKALSNDINLRLSKSGLVGDSLYTCSVSKNSVGYYLVTIGNLPLINSDGETLNYYVKEIKLNDYKNPIYAFDNNGVIAYKTDSDGYAEDGEFIINIPDNSYELPVTGGQGYQLFMICGLGLIAIPISLYFFRMKHKERRLN